MLLMYGVTMKFILGALFMNTDGVLQPENLNIFIRYLIGREPNTFTRKKAQICVFFVGNRQTK